MVLVLRFGHIPIEPRGGTFVMNPTSQRRGRNPCPEGHIGATKDVRPNLDVVPGGAELDQAAAGLIAQGSKDGSKAKLALARSLAPIAANYDIIFIDCPPGNEPLQVAALGAASYVVVPAKTDKAGREGLIRSPPQSPGFARSQRYFDSSIFPVWLVPRRLEYHETKVPIVVTGYGKSSTLPVSVTDLLALPADQDFVQAKNNLGDFVAALLRQGPRWRAGSPEHQAALQKAAADREGARAEAVRKRLEAIEQDIADMNDRSASPEAAFGQHLIRTQTDTFVWGSLTSCWSCEQPMLVWDTRIWARGKYAGAPGLRVKPDVGEKRWENHTEVQRALDKWIHAAKADIPKATIQKRRTKASGRLYGAFVCPGCDSTMGQFFISCIRPEKWSLLSSPNMVLSTERSAGTSSDARIETEAGAHPTVHTVTPPLPAAGASTSLRCRLHSTPRQACDYCRRAQG
jgi:hypothetical protein